jgi:L-lactate permease
MKIAASGASVAAVATVAALASAVTSMKMPMKTIGMSATARAASAMEPIPIVIATMPASRASE